jgi:PHD/YefM family antitoxin component YafN of YafNO toxin-antitoxin module
MAQNNAALAVVGQQRQASVLPSANDWNTMMQMAETLYRSGVLPEHIRNAAAVVAIVQKGRELGIPPMHALQNIAFIKGKTTLQAELMLALVIRDEGAGALRVTKTDNTACTVRYTRSGNEGEYTFTIEDAKQAQLLASPSQMYQKYPAAMLRSRCISAVCRFVFPDIIGGMYTPEELGAVMDEEGNTLALPEPEPMRASVSDGAVSIKLPLGLRPEQWANLHSMATAKGVEIEPTMTPDQIAGAIRKRGGPAIPGQVTPRAIKDALDAIKLPDAQESSPTVPLEGESREAGADDDYADIAAATDQGMLLPVATE